MWDKLRFLSLVQLAARDVVYVSRMETRDLQSRLADFDLSRDLQKELSTFQVDYCDVFANLKHMTERVNLISLQRKI